MLQLFFRFFFKGDQYQNHDKTRMKDVKYVEDVMLNMVGKVEQKKVENKKNNEKISKVKNHN